MSNLVGALVALGYERCRAVEAALATGGHSLDAAVQYVPVCMRPTPCHALFLDVQRLCHATHTMPHPLSSRVVSASCDPCWYRSPRDSICHAHARTVAPTCKPNGLQTQCSHPERHWLSVPTHQVPHGTSCHSGRVRGLGAVYDGSRK